MFRKSLKSMEKSLFNIYPEMASPHMINFDEDEAMKRVEEEKENWIWVEGYKGTDKDMKCRDFQFEIGKEYTKNGKIEECRNGFHLCLKLSDVFGYYSIENKSKYFKVKALVRKEDADRYGHINMFADRSVDKLVAKTIIFISEVETEEMYSTIRETWPILKDAPDKYLEIALNVSPSEAVEIYRVDTLIADGYSEVFANYLNDQYPRRFDIAHALASLDGLSMDVKVMKILK